MMDKTIFSLKRSWQLVLLSFLQYAVWGAYLISMGSYLARVGQASHIGWFYSVQGLVCLFVPALMGMVADKWISPRRLLAICHTLAGVLMMAICAYGLLAPEVQFSWLFLLYVGSVACFMPTLSLTNGVSYAILDAENLDSVKVFPLIRIFGTVGFIVAMWITDLGGMQVSAWQFGWSGLLGLLTGAYALTLTGCKSMVPVHTTKDGASVRLLLRNRRMVVFLAFSVLLGACLQITNGFANPFLSSFGTLEPYADAFGVKHANMLISLSQISETCCFLLIPFVLSRLGIRRVMFISMLAWVLRFLLFALGDPGSGVWLFILSMLIYGVAFDFFNISGSLFIDKETDGELRHRAQGLFLMMTNGVGATVGMLWAQAVVNHFVYDLPAGTDPTEVWHGWTMCWYVFAAYAMAVAMAFAIVNILLRNKQ